MLTSVLYCRHGETESNIGGWLAGSRDVALTDRGRAQAHAAAAALAKEGRPIPVVYSSPQRRALETAAILAQAVGAPVVPVHGLEERRWGTLEGGAVPTDLLREEVPGGESLSAFQARVFAALDRLPVPESEQPPLIVAHAGTWHALCRWMGLDPPSHQWPRNAVPTLLTRIAAGGREGV